MVSVDVGEHGHPLMDHHIPNPPDVMRVSYQSPRGQESFFVGVVQEIRDTVLKDLSSVLHPTPLARLAQNEDLVSRKSMTEPEYQGLL